MHTTAMHTRVKLRGDSLGLLAWLLIDPKLTPKVKDLASLIEKRFSLAPGMCRALALLDGRHIPDHHTLCINSVCLFLNGHALPHDEQVLLIRDDETLLYVFFLSLPGITASVHHLNLASTTVSNLQEGRSALCAERYDTSLSVGVTLLQTVRRPLVHRIRW